MNNRGVVVERVTPTDVGTCSTGGNVPMSTVAMTLQKLVTEVADLAAAQVGVLPRIRKEPLPNGG